MKQQSFVKVMEIAFSYINTPVDDHAKLKRRNVMCNAGAVDVVVLNLYHLLISIIIIKFPGSEWDYVIISLVRSLKREEIDPDPFLSWLRDHLGFLTDEH